MTLKLVISKWKGSFDLCFFVYLSRSDMSNPFFVRKILIYLLSFVSTESVIALTT